MPTAIYSLEPTAYFIILCSKADVLWQHYFFSPVHYKYIEEIS